MTEKTTETGYWTDKARSLCAAFNGGDDKLRQANELVQTDPVNAFRLANEASDEFYNFTHDDAFNTGIRLSDYIGFASSSWRELDRATNEVMNQSYQNMGDDRDEILRGKFSLVAEQGVLDKISTKISSKPPRYDFYTPRI